MHDQRTTLPSTEVSDLNEVSKQNNILGLRALLLNEIRSLGQKATKEQLATAQVKSDLAQTIINSVKVEVLYMQQVKGTSKTGFIPFIDVNEKELGK